MRFGGLIAAIVFAAIAAVVVLRMSAKDEAQTVTTATATAPAVSAVDIYVAATPIPIGATITKEMVTTQPWPEHLMLDGFIKKNSGNVIGMVARAPFQVQEPIIASKLANAQDPNFLAGSLPKGMRALTIQTNETDGLAGFVFPGDRIDILLTRDIQKLASDPLNPGKSHEVPDAVTETLLTNVTVLAVDQRSTSAGSTDRDGKLIVPHTVSLMVSPADAQRLRLGARKGTLTLSLRSLADRDSADPLIITGIGDISQYPDDTAAPAANQGVLVIRGIESQQSESSAAAPTTVTITGGGQTPLASPNAPAKVKP